MGRCSFSNAKLVTAFVVDRFSVSLTRRGYAVAAASQGSAKRVVTKKGGEKESNKTSSWVPDPKTGCYRPESHANDIDVAELHQALFNNKVNRH